MRFSAIDIRNLKQLPIDMLDKNGILKLFPASNYDEFDRDSLRVWCNINHRYGLPTVETVEWLKNRITGRKTIEIGSGAGDLAHYLNIPATDNRLQEKPEIKAYYQLMGQVPITYPDWVEKLEAEQAIAVYKPECVVASWVTQWIDPNLPYPEEGGSVFGIREDKIVEAGYTYILIGNYNTHRNKKIMQIPHEEYRLPFLRSRNVDGEDAIYIWNP